MFFFFCFVFFFFFVFFFVFFFFLFLCLLLFLNEEELIFSFYFSMKTYFMGTSKKRLADCAWSLGLSLFSVFESVTLFSIVSISDWKAYFVFGPRIQPSLLTLLALRTKTANSVDTDETAHEPSHQDQHC